MNSIETLTLSPQTTSMKCSIPTKNFKIDFRFPLGTILKDIANIEKENISIQSDHKFSVFLESFEY